MYWKWIWIMILTQRIHYSLFDATTDDDDFCVGDFKANIILSRLPFCWMFGSYVTHLPHFHHRLPCLKPILVSLIRLCTQKLINSLRILPNHHHHQQMSHLLHVRFGQHVGDWITVVFSLTATHSNVYTYCIIDDLKSQNFGWASL